MANKQFGETLRKLRNAKGYTQQQVADMLGLKNKSTLGSWEVGKSEPDGYTLLKLCKIYKVEDIYTAFGEISPSSKHIDKLIHEDIDITSKVNIDIDDEVKQLVKQYHLLNNKDKELVKKMIDSLEEKIRK